MITDALRSTTIIGLILSFIVVSDAPISSGGYEAKLDYVLEQTVSEDGFVDYARLRNDLSSALADVLSDIAEYDGSLATDEEKKAFWINAYNANMLNNIAGDSEVKNIVNDGRADAFFKSPVTVAGLEVSLDEIEHQILRKQGDEKYSNYAVGKLDPRIHVALNCAAISCPRLPNEAFTAEDLDSQLDRSMRWFVNSESHFRVEDATLVVSALLDWFALDWESTGKPAGDYILSFMSDSRVDYETLATVLSGKTIADLKAENAITFEYLWTVNDIANR